MQIQPLEGSKASLIDSVYHLYSSILRFYLDTDIQIIIHDGVSFSISALQGTKTLELTCGEENRQQLIFIF